MEEQTQNQEQVQEETKTETVTDAKPVIVACDCKCLHQLGYVEVTHADGTKAQMTVKQAQDELAKLSSMWEALKGVEDAA